MTAPAHPENGVDPVDELLEEIVAEDLDLPDAEELDLPDDPNQVIRDLTEQLETARAEAEQARVEAEQADDLWKRSAAEFENFRRRRARLEEESAARASAEVIKRLLPALDGFDAALAMDQASQEDGTPTSSAHPLRQGLSSTRELLLSTLAGEGLEPIEALGQEFDPAWHEAVHMVEGSGTLVVTAELRRGYLLKGRVIRPTQVVVGYQPDSSTDPDPK
ncbi:MAG: nucleotide exchange factor GrpE [bacterium]|nr:nucleotide exchange factor GrpE [bacterium]MCY3651426.1 nucleotide exchange factor GrpE [bacterium]MYD04028.1 nucleotide exchange factor GrpE [Acidimicrobiia bacterium]